MLKKNQNEGVIVAVGTGRLLNDGTRVTPEVKEGDRVGVPTICWVQKFKRDNETYLILNEEDILAVIE
ncbi:Heat shock protein 60 family co-chaperone GroES [Staphylococcus aureus]|uniref:Heat shock protein 60 family co-chaperone GroES n=1 Tax=Staphylococcus aureus TaxID=1280 RepID=A0A8G2HXT2_STAAU|nr:Heat shock protein 60 family co-chaperone GroES [Staphylococcus aureus]